MYCHNCGKFFSEYEIIEKRGELGETLMCCPICGVDDMSETETCKVCEKEFIDGEIYNGICLDCLWKSITYDIALAYMKDQGLLARFMLTDWFGAGEIDHTSPELDRHLEETFRRMVANDKLLRKTEFLAACKLFCLPERINGGFGIEGQVFADWFEDYTKKKKEEIRK